MYKILVRMIERKNYKSIEDMEYKLNVLFLNNQISQDEYEELIGMLRK